MEGGGRGKDGEGGVKSRNENSRRKKKEWA